MAAADGAYRIFRRDTSGASGQGFSDSGESYTGSIGDAFTFAQTLHDGDAAHVYIPYVSYQVLTGDDPVPPQPALTDGSAPVPIAGNRASMVWEQCLAVLDYLNATYGNQSWGLQSSGPG